MPPSNALTITESAAAVNHGILPRVAVLLLAAMLVTACSPRVVLVDHPASLWDVQVRKLQNIDSWQIKARMAVRSQRKGGQATVLWKRRQTRHDLDLYGPFGSGRLRLQQDTDQATLVDSKKHHYTDRNLQRLLYRRVGWQVPFSSLQYWIVGLSAPGKSEKAQWDEQGRLRSLQQNGWQIQYSDYRTVDQYSLPGRLQLDALPATREITNTEMQEIIETDSCLNLGIRYFRATVYSYI